MSYFSELCEIAKDIPKQTLDLSTPRKRSRPPTQTFSDFAIHREQGDWAEYILTVGLNDVLSSKYDVVKYGKSDKIIAGQVGFKKFYEKYQDELETIGKRPDVLVFQKGVVNTTNISMMDTQKADIISSAMLGIEIRSSSFLAKKYQLKNIDEPKKFMSFTPKLEDIQVVMKWVETYNVSHYYAQVFFDEIYMISFKKILETIRDHIDDKTICRVDKHLKNQLKTTIHINISQGVKIGDIKTPPIPKSERTELDSGRLLHYVSFNNGAVTINENSILSILGT